MVERVLIVLVLSIIFIFGVFLAGRLTGFFLVNITENATGNATENLTENSTLGNLTENFTETAPEVSNATENTTQPEVNLTPKKPEILPPFETPPSPPPFVESLVLNPSFNDRREGNPNLFKNWFSQNSVDGIDDGDHEEWLYVPVANVGRTASPSFNFSAWSISPEVTSRSFNVGPKKYSLVLYFKTSSTYSQVDDLGIIGLSFFLFDVNGNFLNSDDIIFGPSSYFLPDPDLFESASIENEGDWIKLSITTTALPASGIGKLALGSRFVEGYVLIDDVSISVVQ